MKALLFRCTPELPLLAYCQPVCIYSKSKYKLQATLSERKFPWLPGLTKRTRWEPGRRNPATIHAPSDTSATDGNSYTSFGTVSVRLPTTKVGNMTADGAETEPFAVTSRLKTINDEEDLVGTTDKEAKTKKKRRKRKIKAKETDKGLGTSSTVENAGLAPADVREACFRRHG